MLVADAGSDCLRGARCAEMADGCEVGEKMDWSGCVVRLGESNGF